MVSVSIQLEDIVCICTVYTCICILPNASPCYVQSLCSYLSKLSADFGTPVVVGDFHFPTIHWPTLQGSRLNYSTLLCDTTEIYFNLLKNPPTLRLWKVPILDLVFTDEIDLFKNLKIHPASDAPFSTDHYVKPPHNSPAVVFDYTNADWNGLSDHFWYILMYRWIYTYMYMYVHKHACTHT